MQHTRELLARVRGRLAMTAAVEDLQRGLGAGLVAGALLMAARAVGPWRPEPTLIGLVALATALAVPLAGVLARRYDERALAALADRALGMSERVSTSLWIQRSRPAGDLLPLVVQDADRRAASVDTRALRGAVRPRLLRRPLLSGGAALLAVALLFLVQPHTAAGETPAERAARLADEDRIADVARRMATQAKRVKETAKTRNEVELERVAAQIQRATEALARTPPRREAALRKIGELSDQAREVARRRAGLGKAPSDAEAARTSRRLAELLAAMSDAGIESVARDLEDLQRRLDDGGDTTDGAPSPDDLRSMAERLDALRRAMESADGMGADELAEKLRSIGNEDLLAKISERLRELAARMERDGGYEGLQGDSGGEPLDLSQLSREELQELLDALDEMAGMEDLARMLRQGGGEMAGGRRLRLGGSGGT